MDFRYAKPIVTDREMADLLTFVETIGPDVVEASGIEQVFTSVGRAVVGNCYSQDNPLPNVVSTWVQSLPHGVVILARIQAQAVICNANYIIAKRVEGAIFALVGYTWLFKNKP